VRKRLTELLDELKQELDRTDDLDAATQAQLEDVADALDEYLAEHEAEAEPGVLDAMHRKLLKLEVEHPRIAAITGETVELISKLGV